MLVPGRERTGFLSPSAERERLGELAGDPRVACARRHDVQGYPSLVGIRVEDIVGERRPPRTFDGFRLPGGVLEPQPGPVGKVGQAPTSGSPGEKLTGRCSSVAHRICPGCLGSRGVARHLVEAEATQVGVLRVLIQRRFNGYDRPEGSERSAETARGANEKRPGVRSFSSIVETLAERSPTNSDGEATRCRRGCSSGAAALEYPSGGLDSRPGFVVGASFRESFPRRFQRADQGPLCRRQFVEVLGLARFRGGYEGVLGVVLEEPHARFRGDLQRDRPGAPRARPRRACA
mmetsp:Transcript_39661/g.103355  ORF Transcript_39661/g.103355 Transcript_39661/m.103355 type:complete len:291 (+) Transcript_39661:1135-2007(+)